MNICIVGCGNVGTSLAELLIFKHKNNDLFIDNLYLLDIDTVNFHNFNGSNIENVGYPKSLILLDNLAKLDAGVTMYSIYDDYSTFLNDRTNIISFDCRDTNNRDGVFNYKIAIDGEFGYLVLNPVNKIGNFSEYKIGPKYEYTTKIIYEMLNIINIDTDPMNKQYILQYLSNINKVNTICLK